MGTMKVEDLAYAQQLLKQRQYWLDKAKLIQTGAIGVELVFKCNDPFEDIVSFTFDVDEEFFAECKRRALEALKGFVIKAETKLLDMGIEIEVKGGQTNRQPNPQ